MIQRRILRLVFSAALCAVAPAIACAEDVTVTTYYPSPRGVYDQLRTNGETDLAMNVTPPANVGIGLPSGTPPTQKLHIWGNGVLPTNVWIDTGLGGPWVSLGANVANRIDLGVGPNTALVTTDLFINNNAGNSGNTLINAGAGNVGIGLSATPSAKLQVVATTGIDPFRVDQLAAPFVINKDGKVGIKNASPLSSLDVRGGILAANGLPSCGAPPEVGYGFVGAEFCYDTGMFSAVDGELVLYANSDPSLYIYNHPPARVTIDPHYPVGIGFRSTDPAPVQRLEVKNGNLQLDDGILRIQPGVHGKKIDLWGSGNAYAIGSQPYGLFMTTDVGFSFFRNTVYTSGVGPAALYIDVNGGSLGSGVTHVHDDLHVYGNLLVDGTFSNPSDMRLKQNIRPLDGALDKMLQLHGRMFEWNDQASSPNHKGLQMGVVAQEVERVFPQWVTIMPNGYKGVALKGFEALTIEAIRQIQTEHDALQTENEALRTKSEELEKRIEALESAAAQRKSPAQSDRTNGTEPSR